MRFDALRRWGPWRLLAAWIAYWVVLAIVVVGPPALRVWRLTRDPGRHGSASLAINNDVLSATIIEHGATGWAASTHVVTLTLWLVGPPLLLYILWLRSRPSASVPRDPVQVQGDGEGVAAIPQPELGAGDMLHATDRRVTPSSNPHRK